MHAARASRLASFDSSHLAKIGNAPRRSLKFNIISIKPNDVIIYLAIAIARSIVLSTKSSEGIHGIWGCSTKQYSRQLGTMDIGRKKIPAKTGKGGESWVAAPNGKCQ
jgi:hypothetical protein